jgi:hypothetical protein
MPKAEFVAMVIRALWHPIQPVYIYRWTSQGLLIAVAIGNWSATVMRVLCDCDACANPRTRIAVAIRN